MFDIATKLELLQLTSKEYPVKLQAAWERAYGDDYPYKYPERFVWLHTNNPYINNNRYFVFYYVENEEIAAWATAIPQKLLINGSVLMAAFGADAFTVEEYRRRGLGTELQSVLQKEFDAFWSISVSDSNRRNKERLDFQEGRTVKFYFKIIKSLDWDSFKNSALSIFRNQRKILRIVLGNRLVVRLLFVITNLRLKRKSATKSATECNFTKTDHFNHELDEYWEEISKGLDFSTVRDAEYLNWRYLDRQDSVYEKYLIYVKDTLAGFLVFRIGRKHQQNEAYILDLMLKNEYKYLTHQVMSFIHSCLRDTKVGVIYYAIPESKMENDIKRSGYLNYDVSVPLISLEKPMKVTRERIHIPEGENWYVSLGDQDLDQQNSTLKQPNAYSLLLLAGRIL